MRIRVMALVVGLLATVLVVSVAGAAFPAQSIGQGSSDIWVMNLDDTNDANVVASYVDQDGNPEPTTPGATIAPLGNTSFPASSSGLGNDWLGSMVLYSDRQLASVAELYWQNVPRGDGWSGAAYTGYAEGAQEIFLPGLAKTASHRSISTIQCVDTVDCEVWMTYRDVNGNVMPDSPYTDVIEPDSQESYDLHDPSLNPQIPTLPTTWYGSLQVTSTEEIAGVVVTHWAAGYAVATNGIVPGTDTTVYFASLNRRNFTGDWKGQSDWSGFTVQNLNDFSIDVYNSIYGTSGGAPVLTFSDTIPALASHNYNLKTGNDVPASTFDVLGNMFLGTAVVTSEYPIVGAISGVRVPSGGLAGGCLGVTGGSNYEVMPVAYRVKSGNTWLGRSALAVQNVDGTNAVDVTIEFMNSNGTVGTTLHDTIPANSVHNFSTSSTAALSVLGTSWRGSVVVTTDDPGGTVTAIMTNQIAGSGYMYMSTYNSSSP